MMLMTIKFPPRMTAGEGSGMIDRDGAMIVACVLAPGMAVGEGSGMIEMLVVMA